MENQHIAVAATVLVVTFWRPLKSIILQIMFRHRLNPEAYPFRPEDFSTRQHLPDDKTFPLFSSLGDDVKLHIFSFIAEAPFEPGSPTSQPVSFLTHSLPLVCKHVHQLVRSNDGFWRDALLRQAAKEPVWHHSLLQLLPGKEKEGQIVSDDFLNIVQEKLNIKSCFELYQKVLNEKIRFTGPVFYMGHPIRLGQPYGLHFFEPRYRRLIAEVMADFSDEARQGGHIEEIPQRNPPLFIHAHIHPLSRATPAALVQVIRCRLHIDGRADVFLMPICYLRLEKLGEYVHSGHLYWAQGLRIGQEATCELETAGMRSQKILSGNW